MARILQVCNADFTLRVFIAPLVRGLIRAGHEVECVCDGAAIPDDFADLGVTVHAFKFPRAASPLRFAWSVQKFRQLVRAGEYLCVNSHNRNASIVGRAAAWLEGVPINLYTAHGCYFHDDQSFWIREVSIRLESVFARTSHFILSQSEEDTRVLLSRSHVDPNRILTIGNGIDVERFAPRRSRTACERQAGLPEAPFRIGAVGRIVRGKGFSDLLEAFAVMQERTHDDQLVLVGGNIHHDRAPFNTEFLRRIDELGLREKVFVTGITDDVEVFLGSCDVFVLPSYREGMPRALIEAMALALPTIATDIRGCREIVVPGVTGFLYSPHSVAELSCLLDKVRSMGSERLRMGRVGRERAVAMFREQDYVERQVECINRLCSEAEYVRLGHRRYQGGRGRPPRPR